MNNSPSSKWTVAQRLAKLQRNITEMASQCIAPQLLGDVHTKLQWLAQQKGDLGQNRCSKDRV
jgi:hypothetical protein